MSTQDQSTSSQLFSLKDYCAKQGIQDYEIFEDHGISGAKESRPALNAMMERVEKSECAQVIVFQFSRYARSVSHLLKALTTFDRLGVRFVSVTEQLDTNSPMGKALFTILGALSALERELIRERVISGLALARSKGRILGRVRKRNSALIESLLEAGLSFRECARVAGCSHGSISAQKKEWLAKKKLAREKEESQKGITSAVQENESLVSFPGSPSPEALSEQLISS